jgi:hypothetical protein
MKNSLQAPSIAAESNTGVQPALNPDQLRPGQQIRRRPAGRSCTVKQVKDDKSKVLINDCGRAFWVRMETVVAKWY